jgi:hypothetical protein
MNDSAAIVKIDHEFLLENFLSDFYKKSKEFIPGQACNCEYYFPLCGKLGQDWGVVLNPQSERFGMLTFEHDWCGCPNHFKGEYPTSFIYYDIHDEFGTCITSFIDNEEILHYKFKNGDTLNEKLGIIEYEGRQVFDCIFKEAITEPYEYDLRIELLKHLNPNPVKFKITKKSPTLLTKPKNEDIINP